MYLNLVPRRIMNLFFNGIEVTTRKKVQIKKTELNVGNGLDSDLIKLNSIKEWNVRVKEND